jgi:hypothetical protein
VSSVAGAKMRSALTHPVIKARPVQAESGQLLRLRAQASLSWPLNAQNRAAPIDSLENSIGRFRPCKPMWAARPMSSGAFSTSRVSNDRRRSLPANRGLGRSRRMSQFLHRRRGDGVSTALGRRRGRGPAPAEMPPSPDGLVAPPVRAKLGVIGTHFRSHSGETANGHENDAAGAGSSSQIAI